MMIEEAEIAGRLGAADDYPVDDFTTLANHNVDLRLPGWPLLSAALTSLNDSRDKAMEIVAAFAGLNASSAKLAGAHLDSLAALAEEKGRKGEAARRAYRHGFDVVTRWPEEARRRGVPRNARSTEAGNWRSGREAVQRGDGLDPRHVLARDYAHRKVEPESGDLSSASSDLVRR